MKKNLLYTYRGLLLWTLFFYQSVSAQITFFTENMGTPSGTTTIASNLFQNSAPVTFLGTADVRNTTVSTGYANASAGGNVFFTNPGNPSFIVSGINTSNYNNLVLKLGQHKSTNAGNNELTIEVSSDGVLWNNLTYSRATGTGTANWTLITPSGSIPSASNLRIRFTNTLATAQFRIDDISLTGNLVTKPEPTNFPTTFSCGTTTSSTIPLSWADAVGTTLPDGYLIKWSSASYAAITDPVDGSPVANGANVQNVAQGVQSYAATGLSAGTVYYFKIWSYTNSGSAIDYKLVSEPQTSCPTVAAPCNFIEDFSNIPTNNSGIYAVRTWTGAGGTWSASNARTDQTLTEKAIATDGIGNVTAPALTNGLGTLTFNYVRAFTNNSTRTLQIWVNGVQVGSDIIVNPSSNVVQNYSALVNVPGNIQFELRTSGGQIIIDDLAWTCFTGTPQPNINIQGNGNTIADGDIIPSLTDGTDFGSAIISGTDVEKSFTLQNTGSATLTLDNPAVVLLDGTKGFTVSVQPATNPMAAFTSQAFKIKFNNAVPGTYVEAVLIGSNDPDTPVYFFTVQAAVLQPLITVNISSLAGLTYAFGQGPSSPQDFVVNGSNLGADITITASINWEISTNLSYDDGNSSPWTTLVLPKSSAGAVTNKTIHARLKEGLAVGIYSGSVTLSSPNATSKIITLSGEVTAGIRDIKVTGNGSSIANGSTTPSGLNNTLFASQNIGNSQTKIFEIKNNGGAVLTLGAISISGVDAASYAVSEGPAGGTLLNQNQTATFKIIFAPTTLGTKNATIRIVNDDPNDNPYIFAIRGGATYCSSPGELIIAWQDFETSPAIPVMNYMTANFGALAPGPNTGFSSGKSLSTDAPKANNLYSEGARGYRIQGGDAISETPSGVSFTFDHIDTSAYTNIMLSFKIAGFSLGSSSNGMDDLNAAQVSTTIHADKLDYVLVEVSPDDGVTWYHQAKVVSGELNLPWSFGSTGTTSGSRNYASDSNLTYFNSTSAARYSAITITNLPAVTNLKVRISAQNNAVNESWILDDVRITSSGLVPKIWNGSTWLPSLPQPTDKVIISADYNSGTFGGFKVCQCEVSSAAALTIAPNTEVKISDVLINNGIIVVQSQGSLIQVNETDSNSGTGTFSAEQNINLSTGRNQYNYIISPAEGFNLKDLYTKSLDINNMPVTVPFALYHNEATNTYLNSSGTYIKGRALAIKEPTAGFAPGQITAVFEGKPVNGQFNYTLNNSNFANSNRGYNLIGNPFPSHMDLVQFYQNNSASNNLSPTFYIWDNNANLQTIQLGDAYLGQAYARFNAATPAGVGTPIKASGDAGATTLKIPTRYVSTGQGFMAKLDNIASESIKFSNSTRSSLASQGFFGKNNIQFELSIDRYWLNLINPSNVASNIAVVYSEGGLDAFTKEDSPSLGTSDEIYSIVGDEKVSINGKSNFVDTDVVAIGTKHFAAGTYKIALDKAEGIFSNSQHIYLKDLQTGILTDLSQGLYSFEGIAGETVDRFQIIYEPQIILATDGKANGELMVYRDGMDFIIKSTIKKISNVTCYDPSGRLILEIFPNQKEVHLDAAVFSKGIYFLKINRHGEITTKKIIL